MNSKGALWTGRVLKIISILFLTFDAAGKIFKESHSVEGSLALGWPADLIQVIGIILLVCTILYAIPTTAVLGAVLISAYLGGAVAIMMRSGANFIFPIIFGVLVWGGLYLLSEKLRGFFPVRK